MAENSVIPAQPAVATPLSSGIRRLAARGAAWTFFGYGSKQLIRFANNLILTRLLFPELFGLMALVNVFILGLTLFSDIGINPSIIQNDRGNDPKFLDTAWTMQVGRGVLLWLGACVLAWPVAQLYSEPALLYVLPVSGLTALLAGFNSTKLAVANRKLMMREMVTIELYSYGLGVVVMIVWAYLSPTVWALVAGGLVTAASDMLLSHVALRGHNNRFYFERSAFQEIYRFGRWIFFSTALTFLTQQSDRLIIGKLLGTYFLGIYVVAYMLASMVNQAIMQMGYRVFFPSYSQIIRTRPERLYRTLRQARLALVGLNWVGALIFIAFGNQVIRIYDGRYSDAGWMLQLLALGSLVMVLSLTYDHVLVARGNTFAVAALNGLQLAIQIAALFLGARYGGEYGVVLGLAAVGWLIYPFKAIWLARLKLWQPEVDLPFLAAAAIVTLLAFRFLLGFQL